MLKKKTISSSTLSSKWMSTSFQLFFQSSSNSFKVLSSFDREFHYFHRPSSSISSQIDFLSFSKGRNTSVDRHLRWRRLFSLLRLTNEYSAAYLLGTFHSNGVDVRGLYNVETLPASEMIFD